MPPCSLKGESFVELEGCGCFYRDGTKGGTPFQSVLRQFTLRSTGVLELPIDPERIGSRIFGLKTNCEWKCKAFRTFRILNSRIFGAHSFRGWSVYFSKEPGCRKYWELQLRIPSSAPIACRSNRRTEQKRWFDCPRCQYRWSGQWWQGSNVWFSLGSF